MNLQNNRPGTVVNLERALKVSDRLGGHIVTGHVDGYYKIINIRKIGDDTTFEILIDKKVSPYIMAKGSVTVDGISLTIAERFSSSFTVTVIPHTIKNTNLQIKRIGDPVNIEVDILARYTIDSKKYVDIL